MELLRLKELFATASRERDSAVQTRDAALIERDQLREEVERLRSHLHYSAPSSGTDSGYETLSRTCENSRAGSVSNSDGFPSLTANAPLQETLAVHGALVEQGRSASVWELSASRGFASDAVDQEITPVKLENNHRRASSVPMTISQELPAPGLDYDELALDFVLR